MPTTPFSFGAASTIDTSSSFAADGFQDLEIPSDLSAVITSALAESDQYDQLSLDLSTLLNITPAATPHEQAIVAPGSESPLPFIPPTEVDVHMSIDDNSTSGVLHGTTPVPSAAHSPTQSVSSSSPPSSPSASMGSGIDDHVQSAPTQPPIAPCAPNGTRKRKRARGDEDEDGPQLSFIASSSARTKAHSKRAQVLLRKALAINTVTRPYVMLYIARPESVCQKNGTAVTFISNNLRSILGDDFLDNIHDQVTQGAYSNATQAARETNLEVERLRQEAAELRAQVAALQAASTSM